jgi:hypothetical protein
MAGEAARRRGLLMAAVPVFVAAVAVGLVIALALSSRSDEGTASGSASPALAASATSPAARAATTAAPTARSSPDESTAPPAPPSAPATTSGGLTARTLPAAKRLGAGWQSRVDNGSAEEGYVGNGTPTQARDPHEVVMTVVPLGCERRSALPTPTHVLEADYRQGAHGPSGVGLRLRFATSAAASHFVASRRADLMSCAAQPAERGLRIVTGLSSPRGGTYVSVRTDATLPKSARTWTEVSAWLGGHDVVLLAVNDTAAAAEVDRLSSAALSVLR